MPGGMGGMGGGLMGSLMRGAMGGMNQNGTRSEPAQSTSDVYDVDRWKRADGLDYSATMVQTVRNDWEQKKAAAAKPSLKQKTKALLQRFSHKKVPKQEARNEQTALPVGGTVITPEMKKASHRINASAEEAGSPSNAAPVSQMEVVRRENYLGLQFQSELDHFFTENPLNSAILAVDQLGLGPLTLNQIAEKPVAPAQYSQSMDRIAANAPAQASASQRPEMNYMNELRESREQRKYDVHVIG